MKTMRKKSVLSVWTALLVLFLSGCTSTPEVAQRDLPAGVEALFKGETAAAQEIFEQTCAESQGPECWLAGQVWHSPKLVPLLQGYSSSAEVRIRTLVQKDQKPKYYVRPVGPFELSPVKAERLEVVKGAASQVDSLSISVQPGVTYELLILSQDGELLDRRKFAGFSLTTGGSKMAVLSCLDDSFAQDQEVMWERVRREEPDVILMIGDNTYGTRQGDTGVPVVSPELLWERYVSTLSTLDFYRWESLVPVWATWDDHDFGMHDGNVTYPHVKASQKIFGAVFASGEGLAGYESGPGISYRVDLQGLDVYVLDNRSFRQPEAEAEFGHFGKAQNQWLLKGLKERARPALLVSGDQFFGGYHPYESFQGSHPKAFAQFLTELGQLRVPVAFLSGDRHLVEVIQVPRQQLGYLTYEVTSSPLHARTYPNSFERHPSPHQIEGAAGKLNFVILDQWSLAPGEMSFQVTAFTEATKPLFQRELKVQRE